MGHWKHNENREKLADGDILTIMMVRPHCIWKKDIGRIAVKLKTFGDVGVQESSGFF